MTQWDLVYILTHVSFRAWVGLLFTLILLGLVRLKENPHEARPGSSDFILTVILIAGAFFILSKL